MGAVINHGGSGEYLEGLDVTYLYEKLWAHQIILIPLFVAHKLNDFMFKKKKF
jgi:hypothetical protein